MAQKNSSFSYKAGKSFLHRTPAWIKIILIPLLSVAVLRLPPLFPLALAAILLVLALFLGFTLREQLSDLKFVIYFAVLLYFSGFVGIFCSELSGGSGDGFLFALRDSAGKAFSNFQTAQMLVKLLCVMQISSLVFKTTTSLEIREGVGKIEGAARRIFHLEDKRTLTDLISFTLCFIPLVFRIWSQLETAWKARQGKRTPKMLLVLLPALFSVGMKSAYTTAKAVMIRSAESPASP